MTLFHEDPFADWSLHQKWGAFIVHTLSFANAQQYDSHMYTLRSLKRAVSLGNGYEVFMVRDAQNEHRSWQDGASYDNAVIIGLRTEAVDIESFGDGAIYHFAIVSRIDSWDEETFFALHPVRQSTRQVTEYARTDRM